jgi:hypothetical protein
MCLAGTASGAPPRVDWSHGLVLADGIGLADRHAPNPAVARGTSRRDAEAAAKKLLAAKVATLPIAAGGTVAEAARSDQAVAARIARAVEGALVVVADPETDGAWRVTLGVPIEAVRQALGPGARTVSAADTGPRIVIVDGSTAKPAVGWTVGGHTAPTLWVATVPAWAKDAPHVAATSAKAGAIAIAGIDATPATLFVIVTGS